MLCKAENTPIRSHVIFEQDVHRTEYENGLQIYVNYRFEEVRIQDENQEEVILPAMSYVVKGGKSE